MLRSSVLVLFIIVTVCTGCARPLGSLYDDGSSGTVYDGDYDELVPVPLRMVYDVADYFKRQNDLTVLVSSEGGALLPIPISAVDIEIEYPSIDDPFTGTFPVDVDHQLKSKGRKIVTVRYGHLSGEYSIEVLAPVGGGDTGNNGDTGINVEWEKQP